jgi:hypothetical protein
MEIVRQELPRDFTLLLTSDYHFGNVNCHKELLQEMVASVQDRRRKKIKAYLTNLGDNLDSIAPDDKRYKHASVDFQSGLITPKAQANAVVELLKPVKDMVLAIGEGNHEAKLWNLESFGQTIADDLGVPFGGYNYILQCVDKDTKELMFKVFCSHGSGRLPKGAKDPIQREANRKAHLKRKLDATGFTDCALFCMGHTHQLVTVKPTMDKDLLLTTSDDGIHQHKRPESDHSASYISPERRYYANTGGFLKLYSPPGSKVFGYAEIALMEPTKLGWVEVDVRDGQIVDIREVQGYGA